MAKEGLIEIRGVLCSRTVDRGIRTYLKGVLKSAKYINYCIPYLSE